MNKISLIFMYSFLLFVLLLAVHVLTEPEFVFMIGSLLAVGLMNIAFRPMAGFAALIAYIVGLGFYNIAANWGKSLNLWSQWDKLAVQIVYSLGAIAVWLLIYRINHLRDRILRLQKEAESLRKLEPVTGVLTFAEFMEKAKLLYSGMKRRKETGYCLICEMNANSKEKPYKMRVIYEKMMAKLLDSTRKNYDLVGNYGGHRAIVFLSNANEQGVQIVLDRFHQKLAEENNLPRELFRITLQELTMEWEQFETVVAPLRGGKAS